MRMVAISEAESNFANLIDQVESEPFAIERDGKPVAYLVSARESTATRAGRGNADALLKSLDDMHTEIEARMNRGEFTHEDLVALARDLDRKGS